MVQAEESYLANHSTGDLSIQNVASNLEMVTQNTYNTTSVVPSIVNLYNWISKNKLDVTMRG